MKKAFSVLLAVLLLAALAGCRSDGTAIRPTDGIAIGPAVGSASDFAYEENGDGITVTAYIGERAYVVIPETIDGKPVTEIGEGFAMQKNIISLRMPNTVRAIGESAFDSCMELESVQLSEGLLTIGERAFWGCRKMGSIQFPESLTAIGGCAFEACEGLKEISIPKNVVTIDTQAFYWCPLERIRFAEDGRLETIGYAAFFSAKITELSLPSSVRALEEYAFIGCDYLASVTLNEGLRRIASEVFDGARVSELVIPASVTDVEYRSFRNRSVDAVSLYFEGDLPENFFESARNLEDVSGVTIYLHEGAKGAAFEGAERFAIKNW